MSPLYRFIPYPSTKFATTDLAERRIWLPSSYISNLGNSSRVIRWISTANRFANR